MRIRIMTPLAVTAVALTLAACKPIPPAGTGASPSGAKPGDVVSGASFGRGGARETHYAECTTPTGKGYRVAVSAEVARRLQDGQPCPRGRHEPLPKDEYPELWEELTKRLPYGGGDIKTCGTWETVDPEEARRWAKRCPPLKWGDIK